ncbi:MAG: hypothetical protein AMJ42_02850 [Deltaproteobacteria bacterium DG_8]|nr:MAG: hypothetical protein AMJ42_02850 [Deltaproteobacteria bacterium DG_8]
MKRGKLILKQLKRPDVKRITKLNNYHQEIFTQIILILKSHNGMMNAATLITRLKHTFKKTGSGLTDEVYPVRKSVLHLQRIEKSK